MPRDDEGLEHLILDDTDGETRTRKPDKQQNKRRPERTPPFPEQFVRLPVSWFIGRDRPGPFGDPCSRLFLLILHLSRWGRLSIPLTDAVVSQVGISRQNKWKLLRRLEKDGWIVVERDGNKAVVAYPILYTGPAAQSDRTTPA